MNWPCASTASMRCAEIVLEPRALALQVEERDPAVPAARESAARRAVM